MLSSKLAPMSGLKTRRPQAGGGDLVLLQGRVAPETRDVMKDAAARSGASMAFYLEAFIQHYLEVHGEMPVLTPPTRQAEELPLRTAS